MAFAGEPPTCTKITRRMSVFSTTCERVAIQAATGQWLQRKIFREKYRSESIALLTGTVFWAALLSLPYVWPFIGAGLLVASLGLALTARYRVGWKRA